MTQLKTFGLNRSKQWYIDQYNRNRLFKDQVKNWKELTVRLPKLNTRLT